MHDIESGKYSKYNAEVLELLQLQKPANVARILIQKHKIKGTEKGVTEYVLSLRQKYRDIEQYKSTQIETDKKIADFHWKEALPFIKGMQDLYKKSSGSQDTAIWKIKTKDPICIVTIGDLQLGSWATDYELFTQITDEIINTPNLYVILVGDLLQMAIKMRGVLEMMDNILPPKFQLYFLDSWLKDIKHKVICSTWDNHSVMRQEDAQGYSEYAEIFRRHTIYHNGIGHLDIIVNGVIYKWAVTHAFRGRSIMNPCHAPQRYMRYEANDRDVAAQGDYHVPGIMKYEEGGKERIAMVCGSIQTNSGYAKRFFSLNTSPIYPCVVLNHKQKMMTPFWSVREWLQNKDKT